MRPIQAPRPDSIAVEAPVAAAWQRLTPSPRRKPIRHVSCAFHDGVLTLRGLAATDALKRIAEALARRVEGVVRVDNDIEVAAPGAGEQLPQRPACGNQGWRPEQQI